jgi:hypothetical protein
MFNDVEKDTRTMTLMRTNFGLALCISWAAVGCGSTGEPVTARGGSERPDGGVSATADSGGAQQDAGGAADASSQFTVQPENARLELSNGSPLSVPFQLFENGRPVANAQFSLADERLGTIDRATGLFTSNGLGGTVTVYATSPTGYGSTTLSIAVARQTEGDPDRDALVDGSGGIGGVGGEGGGTPITDPAVRAALDGPTEVLPDLSWLYPYDGTVWPQGLPAPLLAWASPTQTALAVKLRVEVGDAYVHTSYLGRPDRLPQGRAFTHVSMPRAVWSDGTRAAGTMHVLLTIVARDGQGQLHAYRPAKDLTWTVANGGLKGTVYYNSYGTALAKNYDGALGAGDGRFGGAVLAVRGDSYEPRLVAGTTTQDTSGCRVCHTVSGDGSTLVAQRPNEQSTSVYDLRQNAAETLRPTVDDGKFAWSAVSPDGSVALGSSGGTMRGTLGRTGLYSLTTGQELLAQGLNDVVTSAAMPVFNSDGTRLAFNFAAGPGSPGISGDGRTLAVLDVTRVDANTYAFANLRALYNSSAAPGWPGFLPGDGGLVFQRALSNVAEPFYTWRGARGDLWWTDMDGRAAPLERANGVGYLPRSASHPDDESLNYEPATSPIAAGGYGWVIFTSRRAYADVATRPPYESDPREHDTTPTSPSGPTPKKLWVFAIDIPSRAGNDVPSDTVGDPSHPAFYLPSQELYAGNSRGFWVPDVCKNSGLGCASGDECCGGFCYKRDEFGEAVCHDVPAPPTCTIKYVDEFGQTTCFEPEPASACSNEYDRCASDDDCCGGQSLSCVGGRCAGLTLR